MNGSITRQKDGTYVMPVSEDGFTVRDLLEVLKDADPDALIMIQDTPYQDGYDYLYGVTPGKYTSLLITEPPEHWHDFDEEGTAHDLH